MSIKVNTLKTAGLVFMLGFCSSAHATTWIFELPGNTTGLSEGSYDPLVSGALTATGKDGSTDAYAYLDLVPIYGGLGVCKTNTTSCGSDDNMQGEESLTLSLSSGVFTTLTMNGDTGGGSGHNRANSISFLFDTDANGSFETTLTTNSVGLIDLSSYSISSFSIKADSSNQGYIANVSSVPLPAAAWLFGSALIGLAGVARKRKMS